jgi:hypothetical protein
MITGIFCILNKAPHLKETHRLNNLIDQFLQATTTNHTHNHCRHPQPIQETQTNINPLSGLQKQLLPLLLKTNQP